VVPVAGTAGGAPVPRSLFWTRCRAQLEIVFDGRGGKNSRPYHFEIDPKSASVGLNGFYEADTFQLEFDLRELPFDPDQVAYGAVRIYMWDSQKNLDVGEWAVDGNEMIRGLVDDVESTMVGDEHIVKFTGRDYTAILLDAEWDARDKIKAGGELNDVVQSIADEAAPEGTTARFAVEWRGIDPPPICGGLARSTKKKGLWVKPGKSYWDVIWDLCIQHAYVARVEKSTIIIEEPKTQTIQRLENAPRLIYGQTLTKLEIKRKFAHETVPQVVIIAYDDRGRRMEVKYPPKRNVEVIVNATRDQNPTDALGIPLVAKKDDQMFFPAPEGVIDRKALERYARMRFYQLGRGETVYSLATKHLLIPDAKNPQREINVLQLRPGDAIGVHFDPFNETFVRGIKDTGARAEYIRSLGYKTEVANFIANNLDKLDLFKQDYYFNRADITYGVDEGIEIEIEAVNFAGEVRAVQWADDKIAS